MVRLEHKVWGKGSIIEPHPSPAGSTSSLRLSQELTLDLCIISALHHNILKLCHVPAEADGASENVQRTQPLCCVSAVRISWDLGAHKHLQTSGAMAGGALQDNTSPTQRLVKSAFPLQWASDLLILLIRFQCWWTWMCRYTGFTPQSGSRAKQGCHRLGKEGHSRKAQAHTHWNILTRLKWEIQPQLKIVSLYPSRVSLRHCTLIHFINSPSLFS